MISISCEAVALGNASIKLLVETPSREQIHSPRGCDWRLAAFVPQISCLSLVYDDETSYQEAIETIGHQPKMGCLNASIAS